MRHTLPSLDAMKVFEASARLLSFTKAADELCITKGAVSYQIKQLEQQLGFSLFRRTTRQIFLTDAGQSLFQTVREVFERVEKSIQRIHATQAQDVSIAATTYVAARWLSPRVAKFLETHPEVSVRFEHRVNETAFQSRPADITMLWGNCDPALHPDAIAILPMQLFAVTNHEQAERLENEPDWLQSIPLLYEKRPQNLWAEWFGYSSFSNPRQVIEDANVRVQAAIDGQGMILADAMMQNEIDNGLLVSPFVKTLSEYGYILKKSPGPAVNPLTTELLDWLVV